MVQKVIKYYEIIPKGTTIPTEPITESGFGTTENGQTSVRVPVYQAPPGTELTDDPNHCLQICEIIIGNIPPAPAGVAQFSITFEIDANNMLSVTVKDLGTGQEKKATVAANSISEERQAELARNVEQDSEKIKARKELADARSKLEGLVISAEATLRENADKIPDDNKEKLQTGIGAAKQVLAKEKGEVDLDAFASVTATFEGILYEVTGGNIRKRSRIS